MRLKLKQKRLYLYLRKCILLYIYFLNMLYVTCIINYFAFFHGETLPNTCKLPSTGFYGIQ